MSRGITLKGAAAGAFVESILGKKPKTDDDKHMRIATFIHMEMKHGTKESEAKARLIVKSLVERGLDKTLDQMEGRG